ncbi:CoA transferase [Fontimonas sp. SYSU GA230001]|uniref:CoA transferase n=1 Tax=Fontimonas sp. SYSU GA230001 TaxID=3142450 RepID=UPI0032B356C1
MGATTEDAGGLSAAAYACQLLADLAIAPLRAPVCADEHPAVGWARSGLMALTGAAEGAPQLCPVPLTTCADGALAALASLAPAGAFDGLRGAQLLAERAAIAGHTRQGRIAPGGACRLFDTQDGAIALNLTRDDDWSLLPAWLETDVAADWEALAAALRSRTMHDLVERGRELGLAIAPVVPPLTRTAPWFEWTVSAPRRMAAAARRARVLDLSALWAGPLCSHLLQRCGADVVKLESTRRPDGARRGPPAFFDLLNAGKRSVALDFATAAGRAQLHALVARADIVIEASRPRALRQLGIDAERLVRERGDLIWVSLTGYGRAEPRAQWIAYGDDAGVAAGLSYLMRATTGSAMFVGDAIADPLAGLHAALAAWSAWRSGAGHLISIALVDVVRHCIGFGAPANLDGWRRRAQHWSALISQDEPRAPTARVADGVAPALGADHAAVFAEWGLAC